MVREKPDVTMLYFCSFVKVSLYCIPIFIIVCSLQWTRSWVNCLLSTFFFVDNPLICDCELAWYEAWLAGLRDRDDEMMQKKRTVCTMVSEHREYSVAKMPLEKMNCKRKPAYGRPNSAVSCSAIATNIALSIAATRL